LGTRLKGFEVRRNGEADFRALNGAACPESGAFSPARAAIAVGGGRSSARNQRPGAINGREFGSCGAKS
jgi:hypothetical protein